MLDDDRLLYELECAALAVILGAVCLRFLGRRLSVPRPGLGLAWPLAVAFALRAVVALATGVSGELNDALRTTDDPVHLGEAEALADQSLGSADWVDKLSGKLHVTLFALQLKLLDAPGDASLRLVQALLAVSAIALVAVAVYDVAGPRASLLCAWLLALEPSSILFSTELHKEALVFAGEGIVAVGAARVWTRRDAAGVALLAAGAALAFAARTYVGLFLLLAGALVLAHSLGRRLGPAKPARRGIAAALVAGLAATVLAVPLAAEGQLDRLQRFQDQKPADNINLQLEPVDFTTFGGLARGLPRRIWDFLLRPYPWQQANLQQALGSAGTLAAWVLYALLVAGLWRAGPKHLARAAPFLYVAACTTIAYALTIANAGTGFRHRAHLLVFILATLAIVWGERVDLSALARRIAIGPTRTRHA